MRRTVLCILALVCLTGMAWAVPPTVTVDGRPMQLPTPLKFVLGQGNLVIAVEFFRHLGIEPQWHGPTQTISAGKWQRSVWFTMGADQYRFKRKAGDVHKQARPKARLVGGSPYVPLNACAAAFGYKLRWRKSNNTVDFITPTKEIVQGNFVAYYPGAVNSIDVKPYVGDSQGFLFLTKMPPPFITRINVTTGARIDVAMTDIQLGDHIKAHRDPSGNVWKFEAEYETFRGVVVSVDAESMVVRPTPPAVAGSATLVKEVRYPFGPTGVGNAGNPTVISAEGGFVGTGVLVPGTPATFTINPHTKHVWTVDLRPVALTTPSPQNTTETIQNP